MSICEHLWAHSLKRLELGDRGECQGNLTFQVRSQEVVRLITAMASGGTDTVVVTGVTCLCEAGTSTTSPKGRFGIGHESPLDRVTGGF